MSYRKFVRTMNLAIAAVATALALSTAWARAEGLPHPVPSQMLADALDTFAKETGVQVLYNPALTVNVRSHGAAANESAEAALRELLRDTGLTYEFVNPRTVTLLPTTSNEQRGAKTSANETVGDEDSARSGKVGRSFWDRFRLAQVDQGTPANSSSVEKNVREASDESRVKLEEVVVTAQKREERLIDVPISIVAISGNDLLKRQVTSLDDLQSVVPDLAFTQNGLIRSFAIRGISNIRGGSALVGVYLDEADVTLDGTSAIDSGTYDLQRVEVLRGPQGTLYGEGSAGGTVRLITNDPVLDRFQLNTDVTASFTQAGAPGQRINTMLNIPVASEVFGVRVAGSFGRDGGWIDQPAANLKDINGKDVTNFRVKGLWKVSPRFTVRVTALTNRNTRSTDIGEDDNGNYAQVLNLTTVPRVDQRNDIYNAALTYDLSSARVLSSTSYVKSTFNTTAFGDIFPIVSPPYDIYYPFRDFQARAWVEEFRVTSTGQGPWQWTAGVFYRDFRSDEHDQLLFGQPLAGAPLPDPFLIQSTNRSKSWSGFGDTSYRLTDRLTLGAGLRSFEDHRKTFDGVTLQSGAFHSTDPRAYVQYRVAEGVNTYLSAAKGFRSGGFNTANEPTYAPESIWTYEFGTKLALPRARLTFDVAAFYSNYNGYQTTIFVPERLVTITTNAGKARLKGVELDITLRPVDQLSIGVNGDYIDSRFTEVIGVNAPVAVGDNIDFIPKYQFTAFGEYEFDLGDRLVSTRVDYSQQGRETFRARTFGPDYLGLSDVIHTLDFRADLHWSKNLTLGLFARNLLNDRGFTTPDTLELGASRSRPRTYGIEASITLD